MATAIFTNSERDKFPSVVGCSLVDSIRWKAIRAINRFVFQTLSHSMNTRLRAPYRTATSHRPLESIAFKKRRPFMTLVVAVKTKHAVIIAVDSQISYGH